MSAICGSELCRGSFWARPGYELPRQVRSYLVKGLMSAHATLPKFGAAWSCGECWGAAAPFFPSPPFTAADTHAKAIRRSG